MATKKKMLLSSAGTAAAGGGGAALDITDVFSTYLYEGNGSSQVIDNGINLGQSFGSGSAKFDGTGDYLNIASTSQLDLSGDFTLEAWLFIEDTSSNYKRIFQNAPGTTPSGFFYLYTNGTNLNAYNADAGSLVTIGSFTGNTWFHFAVSRSGSTTRVFVNGTQTYTYSGSTTFTNNGWYIGGGPAAEFTKGYFSNHRVVVGTALYTSNFTPPTSELTAISGTALLTCQGSDPFVDNSTNAFTITQNGDTQAKTFGPFDAAEAGEGGLVWIKLRSTTSAYAFSHALYDTERGALKYLDTNFDYASDNYADSLTSFNSNGFSLGADASTGLVNWGTGTNTYASWTFRKAPKFFDVVTFTGTGSAGLTVSHNLGCEVGSIFVKRTDSTGPWQVYHRGVDATAPEDYYLELNGTGSRNDNVSRWNDTAPTSTEFTLGTNHDVNQSGGTYVAYLFAHNDGDGDFGPTGDQDIIKCGSLNVTSSDVPVDLGFEPQWIMLKNADSAEDWYMVDNMRGTPVGSADSFLVANTSAAESTYNFIDIRADGFNLKNFTANSDKFIYIAIRRGPLAVPEDATEVFDVAFGDSTWGTGEYSTQHTTSNITVDMFMGQSVNGGPNYVQNRLVDAAQYMATSSTAAEATSGGWSLTNGQTGIFHDTNRTDSARIFKLFRRAPGFFDVVAYTGNDIAGRTVSHNLGVVPEMMWVKERSGSSNWSVYHSDLGNDKVIFLNLTNSVFTSNIDNWATTTPTSSVFSLGASSATNNLNDTFIAYLFASAPGVSKVGSYTGNGSSQTIDCGFTSGARFVMIKKTSNTGHWIVFDTERGIVSGIDPFLKLNNTDAENTGHDAIDPDSSGFIINESGNAFNVNNENYIFYAIA